MSDLDGTLSIKDMVDGDRKSRTYSFSLPWEACVGMDLYLEKMQIRRGDFIREAVYEKLESVGVVTK